MNSEMILIIEEILYDFIDSKPEVILIPSQDDACAKDGGMIRVATKANPEWYQRMCKDFPRPIQKSQPIQKRTNKRTIVKRKSIIRIMKTLITSKDSDSKYAPYILDEATRILEQYQECELKSVVPF